MLNEKVFNYFHNLAGQNIFFDQVIVFLSSGFDLLLLLSGILYVIFHKEGKLIGVMDYEMFSFRMREVFIFCVTGIISWILVLFLKDIFSSPRPYEILEVIPLFDYGGMESFPSGHAAIFGALSFGLLFLHRSFGAVLFSFLVLISLLARIVAGIHFPIDILVGIFVGLLVAYFFHVIFRPTIAKKAIVSLKTKK